jgi:hypothetical protein
LGCVRIPKTEKIGESIKETFVGGLKGTEVCLVTVPSSHFWPGGNKPFPLGSTKGEISATDVMCDFFWAHPKRREAIMPSTTMDEGHGQRIN